MRRHHCGQNCGQNCCQKVLPAIVHPTKCCVKHTCENIVVPEIFPTHTTNVHNTNYQHMHYFPHTESTVNEVSNTVTNAGPMGPNPSVGGMNTPPMGMNTPPMGMNPGCCGPRPRFPF